MADRYLNPQTGQVAEWDERAGQWKIGSARPDEVPVLPVTGFEAPNYAPAPMPEMLKPFLAPIAPTLGAMAGGALGGLAAGPSVAGVPLGVLGGEMVGSGLGEAANQLLGITPPSPARIGMTAAAPGAFRGAIGLARSGISGFSRMLPGSSGAAQEILSSAAQEIPRIALPTSASEPLYDLLAQMNPRIDASKVLATARGILEKENQLTPELQNAGLKKLAKGLIDRIEQAGQQGMQFQFLRGDLRRIGERVGALRGTGGEEFGAYKSLYKAGQEALEDAAAGASKAAPAAQLLKAANQAKRMEIASEDLGDAISRFTIEKKSGESVIQYFSPTRTLNWIKDNKEFQKSIPADALEKIQDTLRQMATVPEPLPPKGLNVGSMIAGRQMGFGFGSAGAAGGLLTGDPTMALAAGMVGTAAGATLPYLTSKALMSETGRALLLRLWQAKGFLDHPAAALLGAAVASEVGQIRGALATGTESQPQGPQ